MPAMPSAPPLDIDLDLPPAERWAPLRALATEARELLAFYTRDLGLEAHAAFVETYVQHAVPPELQAELRAVAEILDADPLAVALGNLYYDALKIALGCTAFAAPTPTRTLLARNLDWWSPGDALTRHTRIINYRRQGRLYFRVVGWPGYIGCLSGVAPGRFAVTLNAIVSDEPAQFVPPVSFLLRTALDTAPTFDDAVALLSATPIPGDCLLMVTGPSQGQAVVIERTPTRYGHRWLGAAPLVVTNSYLTPELAAHDVDSGPLAQSACGRNERAAALVAASAPTTPAACLAILGDPGVQMGMTVQQMVLDPASGDIWFP